MEYKQTDTINQTAARCKAENLGVTAWQLREWCKAGKLRHVTCGKKVLIYWPNLIRFLEDGEQAAAGPREATVAPLPDRRGGQCDIR